MPTLLASWIVLVLICIVHERNVVSGYISHKTEKILHTRLKESIMSVIGLGRKFRLEDQRLASRGLPCDDKR